MIERICLANAKVVDVAAEAVLADASILVEDGRIHEVVRQRPSSSEWRAVDAKGRYVVPGLIDGHVHFVLDCGADPRSSFLESDEKQLWEVGRRNAATALRAGITTARDCGAPTPWIFEFQRALARGEFPGPRIITSGCPLTRHGGHLRYFGGEISSNAEVRTTIERQVKAGAGFVKLIASGGGLTPGTNPADADLPLALMREAVDVARALRVRTAAHCHASESIRRAIEAGVDTIEHASFIASDGAHCFDPALATMIRERGIAVCATVIGALRTVQAWQSSSDHTQGGNPAVARLKARWANLEAFVRMGMPLFAGTDCGITNTPFDTLADEIILHQEVGMSAGQALRAATIDSARHLGLADLGEVKPGNFADLLLLDENPLANLRSLRSPAAVMQGGKVVVSRADFACTTASMSSRAG